MRTIGIIPARHQSSRFPGKPLADILGKSMIQRVYEQAKKSKLDDVIVATDDDRIAEEVKSFNGEVRMTSDQHLSGTDRCMEVAESVSKEFDIIVNIQVFGFSTTFFPAGTVRSHYLPQARLLQLRIRI